MPQTDAPGLFFNVLGTNKKEQDGCLYPIVLVEARGGLKYTYLPSCLMILPKLKAKEQGKLQQFRLQQRGFRRGATQVRKLQPEADFALPESPEPTSWTFTMDDAVEAQFGDQDAEDIFCFLQVSFLHGGEPRKPTPCTIQECTSQFKKGNTCWALPCKLLPANKQDILQPVRTPVAILGSPWVCIHVPASHHSLISYSCIHLT